MMKFYIILGLVCIIALFTVLNLAYIIKNYKRAKRNVLTFCVVVVLICLLLEFMMLPYLKPTPVHIEFEEIACVELEKGTFEGYTDRWYTIYDMDYGLFEVSDNAAYKYPNIPPYKGEFAEMDTTKYTYIYTIGVPLKEFFYDVWDCEGMPILDFGISTKWGVAILGSDPDNNKVYMYRIPKMAIANEEAIIK